MTRNQQWILIAIAAVIGAALVVGVIKKKFPDMIRGGKPGVEGQQAAGARTDNPNNLPVYTGAPPAPRGDYNPKLNPALQTVQGQLRLLETAISHAVMKKQIGFEDFEKLHFGGASANVDPAYAVFNPEGKIKFRPMMGAWIDQPTLDLVTKQKGMRVWYTLRRQPDTAGTTDTLYAVIPAPSDAFCKRVRLGYKLRPALKFATDNTQIVTDEAGAIPNDAMKVPSCLTAGDGRVYYFHPLRLRFLRNGGTMWQGR